MEGIESQFKVGPENWGGFEIIRGARIQVTAYKMSF